MPFSLCIDWGNTNIKIGIFEDRVLRKTVTTHNDSATNEITLLIGNYQPQRAILCSVVDENKEVLKLLNEKIGKVINMDGFTPVPINNAYTTPETLGPDRLAMVTAAHHLYPGVNNLVVCAGTCVTYNMVQKTRTFRGGAITPGLHMRLQAMHTFTAKLPEVDVEGDLLLLGYDTDTCMRSGAVHGMAAEIDGMVAAYETGFPDFNAILTGGDAPFFVDKLKCKIFADPDILLKCLNIISDYNASRFG